MKIWTVNDSLDDVFARLDEIQAMEFADNRQLVLKEKIGGDYVRFGDTNKSIKPYRYKVVQQQEKVSIDYKVAKYYTTATIWFSNGGHVAYSGSNIAVLEWEGAKATSVKLLNILEQWLSDERNYQREKQLFDKWCDNINHTTMFDYDGKIC